MAEIAHLGTMASRAAQRRRIGQESGGWPYDALVATRTGIHRRTGTSASADPLIQALELAREIGEYICIVVGPSEPLDYAHRRATPRKDPHETVRQLGILFSWHHGAQTAFAFCDPALQTTLEEVRVSDRPVGWAYLEPVARLVSEPHRAVLVESVRH